MIAAEPDYRQFDDPLATQASRFLDRDLASNEDRKMMARALIRGIDRIERLRAWEAAERALGRANGDPRKRVLRWIDERDQELEAIGERGQKPRREIEDVPAVAAEFVDRPDIETAEDRVVWQRGRSLVADGGESR